MKQDRKAVAVDAETKTSNLKRLKRIEGQIRGIAKMVEEERYCADILMQVSSVQEALKGVSRELMRNHLRHCVTHNIERGKQNSEMYDELVDLFFKHNR
jgi:DNA-binding FrmR family transcriptional regulator